MVGNSGTGVSSRAGHARHAIRALDAIEKVSEKGVQRPKCNYSQQPGRPNPIHRSQHPILPTGSFTMAISQMDEHMSQGGPYAHHNNSHPALSNTASFDSYSSGESTTSWDVPTPSPSRSDFFGNYDRDGFSASPGPMFTNTLGHQFNVASNQGLNMGDSSLMYPESFHRTVPSQDHMTFELHAPLPLSIGSPAFLPEQHYVSPGQTCYEPSRPTPPLLDSYPYDDQSSYYMSPVQATSHPVHNAPPTYTSFSSAPALPPPVDMRRRLDSRLDSRRKRKHNNHSSTVAISTHGYAQTTIPASHFECKHPDCKSKGQKFKRQEHLKRHMLTHTEPRDVACPFCPKRFQENRKDNLKAHLLLHTKKDVDRKRTAYAKGAAEALARLGGLGKKGDWEAERGDVKAICEQARRKEERGM
ncbi:hypothetical protein V495_06585 [Pseudogymnoascus sp. VKM F-4514 (FW-929)]|nr:hypothetical protein V495_06585 [Pseudogymnoascus sp. VKM F-4514 (FW-929)]KFY65732.1 hypothetical protein V497_01323 [Pseudogymnoascus sp. VKM F-4516 (FW-969)]